MFTRQTLRRLANDNSFRRGEVSYNDGNVTKLRRENDAFRATVRGSRSYHVALRLAAAGPEFTCNCPYEFDGICKHSVALCLAVLDAYGTNAGPEPAARPAARTPAPTDSLPDAVRAAWARRDPADKLRFLEQALAKSDDLARQFLAFDRPPWPPVPICSPRCPPASPRPWRCWNSTRSSGKTARLITPMTRATPWPKPWPRPCGKCWPRSWPSCWPWRGAGS